MTTIESVRRWKALAIKRAELLAQEKADHRDTRKKWNEALNTGLKLIETHRAEVIRLKGLIRVEELGRMAERRACEAVEANNRDLRAALVAPPVQPPNRCELCDPSYSCWASGIRTHCRKDG